MGRLYKFEEEFKTLANLIWIIAGNIIYAISINILITPMNLYNGGFLGTAQLFRYGLANGLGINLPANFDITGRIYFLMTCPLFYYAYKSVGIKFSLKSLLSIGISSLCLIIVPVPVKPVFDDYLSACVIAGVIGGVGSGMILRGGSSTGGTDIIGVCMAKTHPNLSVGTVNILFNAFVYLTCLFLFNVQIAIYSFIYTTIRSTFMDRMHTQNINAKAIIVTKKNGIAESINKEMGRGVTEWTGTGSFTGDDIQILMVAVTKYEIPHLKEIVENIDPHAFMTVDEGETVVGNFKKHLA